MPADSDPYDLFVSCARADNGEGWITRFVERLQEEQCGYSGGRLDAPALLLEQLGYVHTGVRSRSRLTFPPSLEEMLFRDPRDPAFSHPV